MRRSKLENRRMSKWTPGNSILVSYSQFFFARIGKIRNYMIQAEFFKNLLPVHQKGRRVPVSLQYKVDKEIYKLLAQGHIEKL